MKIGYLSKNSHELEKLRNRYIMESYDYNIYSCISLKYIIKCKPDAFFTDDHISFKELIKLVIAYKFNLIGSIIIRCSELYTIDYKAYSTEVDKHLSYLKNLNKNTFLNYLWSKRIFLKIWLFKIILNNKNNKVFLPSVLRKNYYLSNSSINNSVIVLRNLPMMNELNFDNIDFTGKFSSNIIDTINSGNYFLLAGNINSFDDLLCICSFSNAKGIPIIIASNDINSVNRLHELYPNNIFYIGMVDHNMILNLVSRCNSGIILYNNQTVNQQLSASSKLFEFLYFNKPVIVSDNQGVLSELNAEMYPHRVITKNGLLESSFEISNNDNSKYYFESEVSNLNNILINYI